MNNKDNIESNKKQIIKTQIVCLFCSKSKILYPSTKKNNVTRIKDLYVEYKRYNK